MEKMKQTTAKLLMAALCISTMATAPSMEAAAKKPKLSKKSISVMAGKKKKISVKKASGASITWKSSKKKVATVKKQGKYSCQIRGVKKGTSVITCKVKKGKKSYSLKCKVRVTKAVASTTLDATPTQTVAPVTSPTVTPASATSTAPTTTTAPTVRNPQTILEAYKDIFSYMGNCVNYGSKQLEDNMDFVKANYNSISLENEMKPDALLGGSRVTLITKEDALEKGYVIPDSYVGDQVPQLNFTQVDGVLETAHKNGLKLRAHTLVWHSQTPEWFFTENYAGSTNVSKTEMDGRLEFYVATVMSHVMEKEKELTGEAGSIVYTWDVVNEYLHRTYGPSKTWHRIYNDPELEPTYVKKAFEIAYAQLEKYEAEDKVILVNNDFDTYFNVDKMIAVVNYINKGETDSQGNPVNICSAIGMQSHVDVDRPTLEEYKTALEAFMATGLEVQITELDVTINWDHKNTYSYKNEQQTDEDQAAFMKDFMEMVVSVHKNRDTSINPKGITGLTYWGLYDAVSWRGGYQSGGNSAPTLFGSSLEDKKPSWQAFLDASNIWYQS